MNRPECSLRLALRRDWCFLSSCWTPEEGKVCGEHSGALVQVAAFQTHCEHEIKRSSALDLNAKPQNSAALSQGHTVYRDLFFRLAPCVCLQNLRCLQLYSDPLSVCVKVSGHIVEMRGQLAGVRSLFQHVVAGIAHISRLSSKHFPCRAVLPALDCAFSACACLHACACVCAHTSTRVEGSGGC